MRVICKKCGAEITRQIDCCGFVDPQVEPLIISRHPGAVEWLRARGIVGEVVAHTTSEQVRGRICYGVLPLSLAANAEEIWAIDMPDLRPEDRGRDLTPEEMDRAGASLSGYRVTAEAQARSRPEITAEDLNRLSEASIRAILGNAVMVALEMDPNSPTGRTVLSEVRLHLCTMKELLSELRLHLCAMEERP